jgi:methionyl-tRNA formyltransferase
MRLVMMGSGTFAEPTFSALLHGPHPVVGLVTQPDRAIGQERGSTRQTGRGMKNIASEHNIPIFQPESINTPDGIAWLRAFQPDLLVVAAYGQILSRDVLAVPGKGGINVHASLLPKYRGAAPVAWAIYHGETQTGVTIIRMSVALDAGDMLAQEVIDIGPEETAGELESRLAQVGASLAIRVVDQIATDTVRGIKQDKAQATKAPKLTKEHGLIDWSRPARDVCNQIRAMQPWPTAYTFWHRHISPSPMGGEGSGVRGPGKAPADPMRLIVYKARVAEPDLTAEPDPVAGAESSMPRSEGRSPTPGEILSPGVSARLLVAAGNQTQVEVLELQPAGKRRMPVAEFLRGHHPKAGDSLGP